MILKNLIMHCALTNPYVTLLQGVHSHINIDLILTTEQLETIVESNWQWSVYIQTIIQIFAETGVHQSHICTCCIGVNRPAIVREILHFGLFRAFPHFLPERPAFLASFRNNINRNNFSCTETFCSKKLC